MPRETPASSRGLATSVQASKSLALEAAKYFRATVARTREMTFLSSALAQNCAGKPSPCTELSPDRAAKLRNPQKRPEIEGNWPFGLPAPKRLANLFVAPATLRACEERGKPQTE